MLSHVPCLVWVLLVFCFSFSFRWQLNFISNQAKRLKWGEELQPVPVGELQQHESRVIVTRRAYLNQWFERGLTS